MALRYLFSNALHVKVSPEIIKSHHRSCQSFLKFKTLRQDVHSLCCPFRPVQKLQPSLLEPNTSLDLCFHRSSLHTSSLCFAGHSKWSNIKHIKGAQDRTKGQKAHELSKQIQAVLTKNPETNPKLNLELASLIKIARSNNIPNDTIDRVIERVTKLRNPSSITVFDGRGLSNKAILIECFSLKPIHTKQILQGIVKKYGFNLNSPALDLFDHKGIVEVDLPEDEIGKAQSDPDSFPLDKYIDMAIEVGAEDVTLKSDSESSYLQFTCGPQDLESVQSNLEAEGIAISSAERTYIPNVVVPVSKEFLETINKLIDKLDYNPDVVKYYFNLELDESA